MTNIKGMQEEPSADLPEGKTCGDCGHWKRCSNLIDDLDGTETHCDWAPSRFRPIPVLAMNGGEQA